MQTINNPSLAAASLSAALSEIVEIVHNDTGTDEATPQSVAKEIGDQGIKVARWVANTAHSLEYKTIDIDDDGTVLDPDGTGLDKAGEEYVTYNGGMMDIKQLLRWIQNVGAGDTFANLCNGGGGKSKTMRKLDLSAFGSIPWNGCSPATSD